MLTKLAFASYCLDEIGLLPSTVSQYGHRCNTWERLVGKPMREITADDARAVKHSGMVGPAAVKGLITTLHAYHKFGAAMGYWEMNGIMLVTAPRRIEHHTAPPLRIEHARLLLATCRRSSEYRLVYLGLYGGLRIGESAAIREADWKWDRLWFRREKTRRYGEVPIHPNLEKAKESILAGSPSDASGLQRAKRGMEERLGISFISHQLRRTFSSCLYDAEVPDEIVGDLLGHTGSVTRLYAKISTDKRKRAIEMLPY